MLKGYEHPPSEEMELWEKVEKEWHKIEPETCQKLIEIMLEE